MHIYEKKTQTMCGKIQKLQLGEILEILCLDLIQVVWSECYFVLILFQVGWKLEDKC